MYMGAPIRQTWAKWLLCHPTSRLAAVASAVISILAPGPELPIRFLLLSAALLAVSFWGLPALLDGLTASLLLGAGLLAITDAYNEVWWLDDLAHLLVPSAVALAATVSLGRHLRDRGVRPATIGQGMIFCAGSTLSLGLSFASAWELYEWWVVISIDTKSVKTSYGDSMMDMALGAGGALLCGAGLGVRGSWRAGQQIECRLTESSANSATTINTMGNLP